MALSAFQQAFADARKSGDKTFEFGGKKYTTQLKEDAPAKAPARAPAKAAASTSENPKENPTFDPAGGSAEVLATSMRKSQSQQRASDASGETAKTNKSVEAANKLTDRDFGSLENIQRRKAAMDTVKNIPSAIGDYVSSLGEQKEKGHGTYVKDGKVVKYAKGGSVSASSRGDGIAQRGKTRGMMVMCGGGMAKGKK